MAILQSSLSARSLRKVMRDALNSGQDRRIRWVVEDRSVVVDVDSLGLDMPDGWLIVRAVMDADAQGVRDVKEPAAMVRVVFYLGVPGEGDGLRASYRVDPACPPDFAPWGEYLATAAWNAVLDVVEAAVRTHVEAGSFVTVLGLSSAGSALLVDLQVGR